MPKRTRIVRRLIASHRVRHFIAMVVTVASVAALTIGISLTSRHKASAISLFGAHVDRLLPRSQSLLTPEQRQASLTQVQAERDKILASKVGVRFVSGGAPRDPWVVDMSTRTGWVRIDARPSSVTLTFDRDAIRKDLDSNPPPLAQPQICAVLSVKPADKKVVGRVETDCVSKGGDVIDREAMITLLIDALRSGKRSIEMPVRTIEPSLINRTAENLGSLQLLATGRSNFKGSGVSRKANVHKALSERINDVIVLPGEEFSFNKMIGPLHSADGWYMALGIFNGSDLRPTLGGGICQTSTTLYRGILAAGLPIPVRKSHSIYVSYYEQYGVGQDVTVYLGSQDFTFVNDTPMPIVLQAYSEGDDAFVQVYGTKDGRTVTIDGPYFSKNAPPDMLVKGKALRTNQIAWKRTMRRPDGSVSDELFVSQYKALPKKLADKWIAISAEQKSQTQELHAAAQ